MKILLQITGFTATLLYSPLICAGSFLSMDISITTSVDNGSVVIEYEVTNNGDETAYEIEVQADLPEISFASPPIAALKAGQATANRFSFVPEKPVAQLVVPLVIGYKDANRYPFSAVSYGVAKFNDAHSPGISCNIGTLNITQSGMLDIKIKSLDRKSRNFTVRLVAPRELTVKTPSKAIIVDGNAVVHETFEISNFSAIAPSTYSILCIVTENCENGRYDDVFSGSVTVVPDPKRFEFLSNPALIWIIAGLLAVFIGVQIYQIRKKRLNGSKS